MKTQKLTIAFGAATCFEKRCVLSSAAVADRQATRFGRELGLAVQGVAESFRLLCWTMDRQLRFPLDAVPTATEICPPCLEVVMNRLSAPALLDRSAVPAPVFTSNTKTKNESVVRASRVPFRPAGTSTD